MVTIRRGCGGGGPALVSRLRVTALFHYVCRFGWSVVRPRVGAALIRRPFISALRAIGPATASLQVVALKLFRVSVSRDRGQTASTIIAQTIALRGGAALR